MFDQLLMQSAWHCKIAVINGAIVKTSNKCKPKKTAKFTPGMFYLWHNKNIKQAQLQQTH